MATIFIVDDEPVLHELYSSVLEISGHVVVANAYDGDEAVEIFKGMNEHPDVRQLTNNNLPPNQFYILIS